MRKITKHPPNFSFPRQSKCWQRKSARRGTHAGCGVELAKKIKNNYHGFNKDIWPQIQYHNDRIYKNFELFIKITLAIAGGLAYLSINKVSGNKEIIVEITQLGGLLHSIMGLFIAFTIGMHTYSKTNRYLDKNNLLEKLPKWLESYMVLFILLVSGIVLYFVYCKMPQYLR